MIIETGYTGDKNTINFFPSESILSTGKAEFSDSKSIRKSPLAEKIFDTGDIASVFITSEMISVTKQEQGDWDILRPQIMATIMEFLTNPEPVESNDNTEENIEQKIKALLNARIRPAIRQDGGDIEFIKYENSVVYVQLQGSCVGCPYAMVTLKDGVEKILKHYIPEIKSVENLKE